MKLVPALASASLILTSSLSIAATPSPATRPDGSCSTEIVQDIYNVQNLTDDAAKNVRSVTEQYQRGEIQGAEAYRRTQAAWSAIRTEAARIRSTYGDFSCELRARSGSMTITGAEIYRMFEKSGALEDSGTLEECNAGFVADFKAIAEQLRQGAADLMVIMSEMMRNPQGASNELRARLKQSIEPNLARFDALRAKYPGRFTCSMPGEDGKRTTFRSDDLDQQVNQLRKSLSQM